VLGLIAVSRNAGINEFETSITDKTVVAFRDKVSMVLDSEVDNAYPVQWIGKVTVETTDGRTLTGRVNEPKGDPGNTLTRPELEDKALRLAKFSGAATEDEMRKAFDRIWGIAGVEKMGPLLA
jgi:2-methylcitrate dehydratase PrpD